jgi:chemotaxis protein methyltransferase CheR
LSRAELSVSAFQQLQQLFQTASGIELAAEKRLLVQGRLAKRLHMLGLESFDAYCQFLNRPENAQERRTAIDLLTTNETYFFREPSHFEQLRELVCTRFKEGSLRVWSAACSTGEEAYSIAMTLLACRGAGSWEIVATDLSERVLEHARLGVFLMQRLEYMPPDYLKRFCMRGTKSYDGTLRVSDQVRNRVTFKHHNLMHDPRVLGTFDIIFLRNVLIYFDNEKKSEILTRVISVLRPKGVLFTGHAEPLTDLAMPIQKVGRALFEKAPEPIAPSR